jgi:hypothetical protein
LLNVIFSTTLSFHVSSLGCRDNAI